MQGPLQLQKFIRITLGQRVEQGGGGTIISLLTHLNNAKNAKEKFIETILS